MEWHFDSNTPIYIQIAETLRTKIISGLLVPGEKLPGIREIAADSGVNPNTVQRGLSVLETEKLIEAHSTAGWYVTQKEEYIDAVRYHVLKKRAEDYLSGMKALGAESGEAYEYLKLAEANINE